MSSSVNAAPLFDKSRTVHGILSPPYSISADLITRKRGCARVPTIEAIPNEMQSSKGRSFSFGVLDQLLDPIRLSYHPRSTLIIPDVTDKLAQVCVG